MENWLLTLSFLWLNGWQAGGNLWRWVSASEWDETKMMLNREQKVKRSIPLWSFSFFRCEFLVVTVSGELSSTRYWCSHKLRRNYVHSNRAYAWRIYTKKNALTFFVWPLPNTPITTFTAYSSMVAVPLNTTEAESETQFVESGVHCAPFQCSHDENWMSNALMANHYRLQQTSELSKRTSKVKPWWMVAKMIVFATRFHVNYSIWKHFNFVANGVSFLSRLLFRGWNGTQLECGKRHASETARDTIGIATANLLRTLLFHCYYFRC